MQISTYSTALAAAILIVGPAQARPSNCSRSPQAAGEIQRTVNAFFDALRTEDDGAFRRLTTRTFYSFDGGERYSGVALLDVVRKAHANGVQLNWSIGPIDTKVRCNVAWSAWDNVGAAGIPPAVNPVRWLESAVLVRENGTWKIDFFHSQRAAQK